MQHFQSLDQVHLQNSWLTIGSFDGVHLGHQKVAQELVNNAHAVGAPAVVLTFYPHPSVILRNRREAFYLTSPEERAKYLSELGIDVVITHPFSMVLAATPARNFIETINHQIHPSHILIGQDFALGRNREGNVEYLRQLGQVFNYQLDLISPVQFQQETISSSQIRKTLANGDIAKAASLLGHHYNIKATVVSGDGRGKQIGVPTANLDIWPWRALPKPGVYACFVQLEGETYPAVTNVGFRPTFEDQPVAARVETHILDFSQDLYGRQLNLEFIDRLRDEQRFQSVQALVDQIQQDIKLTRKIL